MSDQLIWDKVLCELELEVSPAVFNTMFKRTQLSGLSDGVITVACSSPMIQRLIETRYYGLLKRVVGKNTGKDVSIVFTIDSSLGKTSGLLRDETVGPLFEAVDALSLLIKKHGLHPDYMFEHFAVSSTNQLAFAAASHVAKNPGDSYNPLLLYGGVGVGKTHLMQAIAHEVLRRDPAYQLVISSGEEFTNEIIEAIRTKTTIGFRNKFRRAKLLCIDDVQFIAGREAVQEEFFHTFNALLRNGGQIVLTSDKAPSEILKLEARLKSRLEGGLLVDIAPPDFELRTAIFLIKAKHKGLVLPVSLAKLIAAHITNTRRLEGFLMSILSELNTTEASLNEEFVTKLLRKAGLGQVSPLGAFEKPTRDKMLEAVCSYFNIKPTLLKGRRRNRGIVLPRQILMFLLRTELNLPFMEIGAIIGGRDHTTVLYAVEKISTLFKTGGPVQADVQKVKQLVYEQPFAL